MCTGKVLLNFLGYPFVMATYNEYKLLRFQQTRVLASIPLLDTMIAAMLDKPHVYYLSLNLKYQ